MTQGVQVSHMSTYSHGGAAFAARRLHEGLRSLGVASRFWYGPDPTHDSADPSYRLLPLRPIDTQGWTGSVRLNMQRMRLKRARKDYREHLSNRPEGFEVFSAARQFGESHFDSTELECDILNLHWIAFFCDYPSFFNSIPPSLPIVWTLHDMNPFTGGCHYSSGCAKYTRGCGDCPQVLNSTPNDVSRYTFQIKKRTLRSRQIHVVTPSRWLSGLAQQSPIWPKGTSFSVIPYGLELDQYQPIASPSTRKQLGLSDDSFVLAFGAEDLSNPRKGMQHLIDALKELPPTQKWEAIIFGGGELPPEFPTWIQTRQVGYLSSAQAKAEVYSAADVFLMPSTEDNQPQTGLESLACGTPVIAFDAGGIPEYVRHLETGLLAQCGDASDLGRQILCLANQSSLLEKMGRAGRVMMEEEFALEIQAERYLSLYQKIASDTKPFRKRVA
ncbi:MAG: glycosyltransferase [Planctomycetota bacterium]|nr:glycosyltransferase [Planctomycetota bacterium]